MVNITKEKLEIDNELKKKIEFICSFCNTKLTIINGTDKEKYLAIVEKSTLEKIIAIAKEKSSKRGAFEEKIFLEKVITKK